jgi:AcrR family transcriptional regulator
MQRRKSKAKRAIPKAEILAKCLTAFVQAKTIELSLDQLAAKIGISKRMLIHHFGSREMLEEQTITLLEDQLRAKFSPESFTHGASLEKVVMTLWNQTIAAEALGVLLIVMDLTRRAWKGSPRAQTFYAEQQRIWVELLMNFMPDQLMVEWILQVFQGAVLSYLVTGDPEPGRRSLTRALSSCNPYR